MTLNTKDQGPVAVLVPSGRVGTIEMEQMKGVLRRFLQRGKKQVVVNLEYVPDLSWSAIGALVEKSNEFRSQKGEFKLAGLNHSLRETFRALGAHRTMDFYDTEAEALKSFGLVR